MSSVVLWGDNKDVLACASAGRTIDVLEIDTAVGGIFDFRAGSDGSRELFAEHVLLVAQRQVGAFVVVLPHNAIPIGQRACGRAVRKAVDARGFVEGARAVRLRPFARLAGKGFVATGLTSGSDEQQNEQEGEEAADFHSGKCGSWRGYAVCGWLVRHSRLLCGNEKSEVAYSVTSPVCLYTVRGSNSGPTD